MDFWKTLPAWSKLDELDEERHAHHLQNALSDPSTQIDKTERNTYILYGEDQALLLRPVNKVIKWGIELYVAFISLR